MKNDHPAVEVTMGTCYWFDDPHKQGDPNHPHHPCVNWKPLAPSDSQGTKLEGNPEWSRSYDAQVWAKKFVEYVRRIPEIATDEGTMIGWFANAIMAGYDEHARKVAAPLLNSVDTPAPVPERTNRCPAIFTDCFENALRCQLDLGHVDKHVASTKNSEWRWAAPVPEPEPRHEIASGREFAESEQNKATKSSAESPAKTGGGTGNGPDTTPENREDELTAPSLRNEPLATKAEPPARKDELGTCPRCGEVAHPGPNELVCVADAGHEEGSHNWWPREVAGADPVAPQASPEEIIWRGGERWIVNDAKTGYVRLLDLAPKQERRWMKENETEVKAHAVVASPEAPAKEDEGFEKWWQDNWPFTGLHSAKEYAKQAWEFRARLGLSGSVYELCALEAEKSGSRKCGEGCDSLGHCYACPYEIARRIRELGLSGRAETTNIECKGECTFNSVFREDERGSEMAGLELKEVTCDRCNVMVRVTEKDPDKDYGRGFIERPKAWAKVRTDSFYVGWDLCAACFGDFKKFIQGTQIAGQGPAVLSPTQPQRRRKGVAPSSTEAKS